MTEHVANKKGIFEYVLGGSTDKKLLAVRIFSTRDKQTAYRTQTEAVRANSHSNCPYCVIENGANKHKIWALNEMDADHITAWSRGGATDLENCQMLCAAHNRAKGNR